MVKAFVMVQVLRTVYFRQEICHHNFSAKMCQLPFN